MEQKPVFDDNGREVSDLDLNRLGDSAGLADDRVFAELFRLTPFSSTPVKGVLPYAVQDASAPEAIVAPGTPGSRQLVIQPFRGFVGSRTDASDSGRDNWRDIRSAISVGTSALTKTLSLAANSSGNPRWDLVYATITPDIEISESRYLKDPSTKAVAAGSYVVEHTCAVSIGAVTGTPGVSPALPATPADSGGAYIIPLAYVRVVTGAVTFTAQDIREIAPVLQLSRSTGAASVMPANHMNKTGGSLLTRVPWPTSGNRPGPFIPPSMVGSESRFFGFQLASILTASIHDGDIVDDSIDWRKRIFRWQAYVGGGSTPLLAWDPLAPGSGQDITPSADSSASLIGTALTFGFGQSLTDEDGEGMIVAKIDDTKVTAIGAGAVVELYIDADGVMRVFISGTPNAQFFFWVDATGPFPNP